MATSAHNPSKSRPRLAQRLLTGAIWAFAAKVIGVLSGLVVNAILARMLSAEEMGAYFLVVSMVIFAALIARFGLKQTVVRLVAESVAKGIPGRAASGLAIVFLVTSLGVLLVCGAYFMWLGDWLALNVFQVRVLTTVTGIVTVWIALLAFQVPIAESFRGLNDIRIAVFMDNILATMLLAIVLGCLSILGIKLTFEEVIIATVLMLGSTVCVGFIILFGKIGAFSGPGTVTVREVISISGPFFVTNIFNQAFLNSSLWIVAAFLTAEEVATYGAAWKLVSLVAVPLTLVNMSVQPIISELYVLEDRSRLQNALRGSATLASLPAAAILLMFIVFGQTVLDIVYGAPYAKAAVVLAILSIGQLTKVATGSCSQVLAMTGHQRQLMVITLTTGPVTIIASMVAAKYWGIIGVATVTSVGLLLQNMITWMAVFLLTGLWTHSTINIKFIRGALSKVVK